MKHAFLIAAHHQFDILGKLLQILDDNNIDFYIHIDKKTKSFPEKDLNMICKNSKVFFIERIY